MMFKLPQVTIGIAVKTPVKESPAMRPLACRRPSELSFGFPSTVGGENKANL